ncbi:heptaprenylglyceryl phosphate synthase [Paenibacillus koleovorans]|uniref:heptaprenylglyceryl phosphate synthase n=1 Tax=Paenibacillus koleovorans TaxID=121608 RepID=UPI000FD942F1|nr:heptaprenylglyceryl phosphate synthase [Paenibacillus koleovorans]
MRIEISRWKHVFKLDPDKELADEALERICESGTDAVIVGGSTGVTFDNTVDLLARIRRYELPCVLEVSDLEAIVPGFDLYLIPIVLNASDPDWIVGKHMEAIREYGPMMHWEQVAAEGYVILNGASAAARLTGARTELDVRDVTAYARLSERMFHFPIFYVEYSGVFGDMELVRRVAAVLERSRLFYGGGIDGAERAIEAARAAHTIVVGNIVYEDLERALATVRAVREAESADGGA